MIITCVMSVPITYMDTDGKPKTVVTRPGSHNYPMLDHKDPQVAEQLRVYRKHSRIGFDELLETDQVALKKIDKERPGLGPTDRAKALLAAVSCKPSPNGKVVKGKKNVKNPKPVEAPKAKDEKTRAEKNTSKR